MDWEEFKHLVLFCLAVLAIVGSWIAVTQIWRTVHH